MAKVHHKKEQITIGAHCLCPHISIPDHPAQHCISSSALHLLPALHLPPYTSRAFDHAEHRFPVHSDCVATLKATQHRSSAQAQERPMPSLCLMHRKAGCHLAEHAPGHIVSFHSQTVCLACTAYKYLPNTLRTVTGCESVSLQQGSAHLRSCL